MYGINVINFWWIFSSLSEVFSLIKPASGLRRTSEASRATARLESRRSRLICIKGELEKRVKRRYTQCTGIIVRAKHPLNTPGVRYNSPRVETSWWNHLQDNYHRFTRWLIWSKSFLENSSRRRHHHHMGQNTQIYVGNQQRPLWIIWNVTWTEVKIVTEVL